MKRHTRLASLVCVLALSLTPLASPVFADSRDDLVQKQKEEKERIESIKSSLEGVDTNLQAVYLQLQETQAQIPVAQEALSLAQGELATASRQQQVVAAQLDSAQAELQSIKNEVSTGEQAITENRAQLGAIARAEYRGDTIPSTWDMLSGSSSSSDFLDAVAASRAALRKQTQTLTKVRQATAAAKNRQARQSAVEETISSLKTQADNLVKEKAAKEAEAQKKASELQALQANYQSQSSQLEASKTQWEQSLANASAAYNQTAAQIAAIDEENRRAAAAAAAKASASGGSGAVSGGSFLIPVIPRPLTVTSPFGMRNYPFGGYYMHNGVDLRSACGQAQVAPGNGTIARVIPASGNGTHGNQIYINLGTVNGHSWVVVTNHLSGFNVSVGQRVKQGDVIGWTGQTGQVTGCHVHMEVWRDGKVINPMSLPGFN